MKITKLFIAGIMVFTATSLFLTGCDSREKKTVEHQKPVTHATATLKPLEGSEVKGKVTFTVVEGGVKVVADVENLKPGKHGFHIHEHGDCGGHDGAAAGGHFNPINGVHAGPTDPNRHVGDLGNLVADEHGKAHYEFVDNLLQLEGTNTIVGRSIVVHADEDDLHTQPAGNSGARVACGIIE